MLEERAQAYYEEQVARAASKRGKGKYASAPPYPNLLKVYLKEAGYTQRVVAQEMGIPERTLRHWVRGEQVIPQTARKQLAQVISCEADDLAPDPLVFTA